jgi:hypothetical protein
MEGVIASVCGFHTFQQESCHQSLGLQHLSGQEIWCTTWKLSTLIHILTDEKLLEQQKVDYPSREWIRTKCAVVELWLSIKFDLLQRLVLPKNLYEQSTQGITLHSGNFANRTHYPVLFWTKYYWNIISMAPNAVLAHRLTNAFGISNVHMFKQLT